MSARAAPGATGRRAALSRTVEIRRLDDREAIRARLLKSVAYAAYALAYLDRRLYGLASFYEAVAGDRQALVMHARGGLGPSTFCLGDPDLVHALVKLHPGPRQAFITAEPAHVDLLLETHNLWRPQTMLRMSASPATFVRPESNVQVRRLIEADASDLNRLYSYEDDSLHYSGKQIDHSVYYGAYARGRLVAAAGTHIYSPREGVAVIGNVFTHPDHRGHGYATAVTAAVTEHLLEQCRIVVLNVDPANRTARHIYETLGFVERGRLVEAMATRRAAYSPLPALRRLAARWRSPNRGTEQLEL